MKEYSLDKNVQFLGAKDRSFIYENLCEYDLLIQPSYYEGFGLTIVEGMFASIPVLVSNVEGPREIIIDGVNGFIFKSSNPRDLAEKIKMISENYIGSKIIARKVCDYALSNYTLMRCCKNMMICINRYYNSSLD